MLNVNYISTEKKTDIKDQINQWEEEFRGNKQGGRKTNFKLIN